MQALKDLKPKNIIIRMPNWIGDLVMATPILTDVRRAYPEAHITAMCKAPQATLLQEDKDIDEVFSFRKTSLFNRHNEHKDLIEKVREGHYDLGILLTNWFSSAWWFWQGNVQRRMGYNHRGWWRRFLLTDPIPLPPHIHDQHLVVTYKMLLQPLGIPLSSTKPRLFLLPQEIEEAKGVLKKMGIQENQRLVGINPGATYGSAKCWLPERFRKVTEELLKNEKLSILYFGDEQTSPLLKQICQDLPPRVVNLAGLTSLRELACLIKLCTVFLTNDSGPMHIAAALGTPLVSLFGSTSDQTTGPFEHGTVIHKHVECSPCYKRICPIDFRCMKRIEASEVLEEIHKILRGL